MTPPITSIFGPGAPLGVGGQSNLEIWVYTSAAEAVPPGTHRLTLVASPTYPIITTPLQLMARQGTQQNCSLAGRRRRLFGFAWSATGSLLAPICSRYQHQRQKPRCGWAGLVPGARGKCEAHSTGSHTRYLSRQQVAAVDTMGPSSPLLRTPRYFRAFMSSLLRPPTAVL